MITGIISRTALAADNWNYFILVYLIIGLGLNSYSVMMRDHSCTDSVLLYRAPRTLHGTIFNTVYDIKPKQEKRINKMKIERNDKQL